MKNNKYDNNSKRNLQETNENILYEDNYNLNHENENNEEEVEEDEKDVIVQRQPQPDNKKFIKKKSSEDTMEFFNNLNAYYKNKNLNNSSSDINYNKRSKLIINDCRE